MEPEQVIQLILVQLEQTLRATLTDVNIVEIDFSHLPTNMRVSMPTSGDSVVRVDMMGEVRKALEGVKKPH